MNVIAHLSDIHIDDDPRSSERTRVIMDYLNALPADLDAVLVSGDIADHALPREYERARELLACRHPIVICPGNHDDRAAFRKHLLGAEPDTVPVNQVLEGAGFVLAACDSSIPGAAKGELADETLAWLDGVLEAARGRHALVAFHHPPALLHVPVLDAIRQYGGQRLARLLERHPHVRALLAGHAHTPAATTFAGRPLLVAPGVVSTLRMPWEPAKGVVDLDQPPSLAFHVLDDEGRLTTHYRMIL
ncbi:metallophosphoesterase [Nonomuraea typhae]|uniref:metallophosphoesterase n=1 Tax=Nonomuraea typhae TaxID=2603600 RepID=UPI0012FCA5CF|nr:metallophosphoesterase [Nonomuraea typhae]